MFDCIVVGAGAAGAVAARQMAESGKSVLVLEKRHHVGGNCYDFIDEAGVLVHQYGPHIFHTNSRQVYEYLSRFTEWYPYHHEVLAYVDGTYLPVPFNLNSIQMVFSEEKAGILIEKLVGEYGYGKRLTVLQLREHPDSEIREVAEYVYENIFLKYTMKQWGQTPEQVDQSVIARVPVILTEENGYFQDAYQGMPAKGYTKMFEALLQHENIKVQLSTPASEVLAFRDGKILYQQQDFRGDVIYTGPVDALFHYVYGALPYRTLRFDFETYPMDSYQPAAVVNYTVSEEYTRITEFKKLTGQLSEQTTIVKEYPGMYTGTEGETPYYAILNPENRALYAKYQQLAAGYPGLHLLGRLAEYQYYNIDAIVERALQITETLLFSPAVNK